MDAVSVPYAGIVRIRFDGLAFASQPQTGHPNGFAGTLSAGFASGKRCSFIFPHPHGASMRGLGLNTQVFGKDDGRSQPLAQVLPFGLDLFLGRIGPTCIRGDVSALLQGAPKGREVQFRIEF